jgi:glycosyltransferase involved in cell wall biosynthesis
MQTSTTIEAGPSGTELDRAVTRLAGLNGINVAGYLRTESGVGAAGRGYVRAAQALGIPVALRDLSSLSGNRALDATHDRYADRLPYDVNLVCIDVEPHFAALAELGPDFLQGRYNVGIWAWELPEFPQKWHDRFAWYDEIWVASSFIANALSPVSPIPVVRVPPVLTPKAGAEGSRERGRRRLGAGDDEYVFLFVFDFNSHVERKNPLAAIEAFRRAFGARDRARLVFKCVNAESDREGFERMSRAASGVPRIDVHAGYWPGAEVRDLMAACDAYVSLHRSEGTGLTITDAMSLGKPVIATGWSGNMDFMTVGNSYPVGYELVEVERTVGPYDRGQTWAEPSVAHAAELMRRVFDRPDEAAAVGARAARDVAAGYSDEAVAALMARRLEVIARRRGPRFEAWRSEQRARYFAYRELIGRVSAIAGDLPAGSVIAVASKGDEALVRFRERTGWHFPRTATGVYAGHHPRDSAEAVGHLTELQRSGAGYFLLPATMAWWLEHYAGLADVLRRQHRMVHRDEACTVYQLRSAAAGKEIE